MLIKHRLIVEHNLCSLIENYRSGEWISKETDIKLQFTQLFTDFTAEEIEHGINFLREKDSQLYELLYPIILDYKIYGLKNFVETSEPVKQKWWEKLLLFLMKFRKEKK